MASFTKKTLNSQEWTLVLESNTLTFQNLSQYPIYVNFSGGANTVPSDTVGLLYDTFEGELKRNISDLTSKVAPTCMWAKVSGASEGSIMVEEE